MIQGSFENCLHHDDKDAKILYTDLKTYEIMGRYYGRSLCSGCG